MRTSILLTLSVALFSQVPQGDQEAYCRWSFDVRKPELECRVVKHEEGKKGPFRTLEVYLLGRKAGSKPLLQVGFDSFDTLFVLRGHLVLVSSSATTEVVHLFRYENGKVVEEASEPTGGFPEVLVSPDRSTCLLVTSKGDDDVYRIRCLSVTPQAVRVVATVPLTEKKRLVEKILAGELGH